MACWYVWKSQVSQDCWNKHVCAGSGRNKRPSFPQNQATKGEGKVSSWKNKYEEGRPSLGKMMLKQGVGRMALSWQIGHCSRSASRRTKSYDVFMCYLVCMNTKDLSTDYFTTLKTRVSKFSICISPLVINTQFFSIAIARSINIVFPPF